MIINSNNKSFTIWIDRFNFSIYACTVMTEKIRLSYLYSLEQKNDFQWIKCVNSFTIKVTYRTVRELVSDLFYYYKNYFSMSSYKTWYIKLPAESRRMTDKDQMMTLVKLQLLRLIFIIHPIYNRSKKWQYW